MSPDESNYKPTFEGNMLSFESKIQLPQKVTDLLRVGEKGQRMFEKLYKLQIFKCRIVKNTLE